MQDVVDTITSDFVGGKIYEAESIEALADAMNATPYENHHVHKANLLATVAEYNAAAEAGTGDDLFPTRASNCVALGAGPYHAIPLRIGIYCTMGGIAINNRAQVVDGARRPIQGLYATLPAAGGQMDKYYAGGIAHAGVNGMWAADDIAGVWSEDRDLGSSVEG